MRQGSFLRKGLATAADPGTRPGLHGQTLLSSGHPDLDRLLGGGLPLGSLLLLLEDGWSAHHATLLRYFLAESAACGQTLLLAAAPAPEGGLPKFIPAELKGRAAEKDEDEGGKEQEQYKLRIAWQYRRYIQGGPAGAPAATRAPGSLASSSSGGVDSSRGQAGAHAPAGDSRSGSGSGTPRRPAGLRDWCHRFDLLKAAGEEGLQQCRAELVDCSGGGSNSSSSGDGSSGGGDGIPRLLSAAAAFVQSLAPPQPAGGGPAAAAAAAAAAASPAPPATGARAPAPSVLPPRGPQHVGRIAVLSLGSLGWQPGEEEGRGAAGGGGSSCAHGSWQQPSGNGQPGQPPTTADGAAVARALLQLKGLVRDQRCAAVVSVPAPLFSQSDLALMQHLVDGVVALESVADGSDIARLAPDPASVAGLLHLRKLPCLGAAAPPAPEAALHLVRHKRRRLAITPVEIDPEAELADAEAAGGAGRSAAAALCGGPPKADGAVDF